MASVLISGVGLALGGAGTTAIALGMASTALSAATANPVVGPRLKNLQPPDSRVGETISKGFGKTPSVGTIIWATPIKEHKREDDSKGGGKGGPRQISYTYTGSYTLSFGCGPITRVSRLMLGQKPIYDWNGGAPLGDEDYLGKKKNGDYFSHDPLTSTLTSNDGHVRIRLGTETQLPDSSEEADVGVGNASAYRGQVTITFEDLRLDLFGGQWPQVTALLEEPTTNIALMGRWICEQTGLTTDDFDFCEIADKEITGFVLPEQQPASSYLNQLGIVGTCDFPERDWKLRAIKRGRDISLTIPSGDLQCHDVGSDLPDFGLTRADEVTLPREMDVTYIDSARNYTTSTATAWREVDGESGGINTIDLSNVVLSNPEARRYAEIGLYTTLSQRMSAPLALPSSYAYLSDADVVKVETDFGTYPMILQSSQESLFGSVTFTANSYQKSAYTYPLPDDTAGLQPSVVQVAGDYFYAIIDTNLLGDNSSNVPLLLMAITTPEGQSFNDVSITSSYFSASQTAPTGNGILDLGRLFNQDNSTSDDNQFTPGKVKISNPSSMGEVVGTLGAYPYQSGTMPGSFDLIDNVNTITVDMIRGSLSSLSQDQFLYQSQGQTNTYIVGREIIKVRDWNFVGTFGGRKRYTGSYIYRGRRGTEWYSDQHRPSEAFVDVTGNIYYAQMLQGAIGQSIELSGGDPNGSTSQSISLSFYGNCLMPYSPHAVRASRDGSGNMTISWDRRSRFSDNNWWTLGSAPALGESMESYDLEIVDTDGTVLRTYAGLAVKTLVYSASDQVSDFGTMQDAVNVRVYQNSAIVGRGYVADIVI